MARVMTEEYKTLRKKIKLLNDLLAYVDGEQKEDIIFQLIALNTELSNTQKYEKP